MDVGVALNNGVILWVSSVVVTRMIVWACALMGFGKGGIDGEASTVILAKWVGGLEVKDVAD